MKAWFVPPLVVPLVLLAIIVIYGIFRAMPEAIALYAVTAFFVLGFCGTIGKALFDDSRVRRSAGFNAGRRAGDCPAPPRR